MVNHDQTMHSLSADLRRIKARSTTMIVRGELTKVNDSAKALTVDATGLDGEAYKELEVFMSMGEICVPKVGDEVLILCVGGTRSGAIAICTQDRKKRKKNNSKGDTGKYHEEGHYIRLTTGGDISLVPFGVGKVHLGGDAKVLPMGRVTDPVAPDAAMVAWMTQVTTMLTTLAPLFNAPPAPINSLGPGAVVAPAAPPAPTFATIFSGSPNVNG